MAPKLPDAQVIAGPPAQPATAQPPPPITGATRPGWSVVGNAPRAAQRNERNDRRHSPVGPVVDAVRGR